VRDSTLLGQPLDPGPLETVGEPVPIAEEVGTSLQHGYFSASANGMLAYRRGGGGGNFSLAWFDRAGKQIGSAGDPGVYDALALSPDGTRVAVGRNVAGNLDLWLLDLVRNTSTRFTSGRFIETAPVWSPDGSHIAFSSNLRSTFNLYQKLSSGAGQEEMLLTPTEQRTPDDWSRDGRFLLYTSQDPRTKADL
jgi:WD40 repeat protein